MKRPRLSVVRVMLWALIVDLAYIAFLAVGKAIERID